jgi:hypothetical protein
VPKRARALPPLQGGAPAREDKDVLRELDERLRDGLQPVGDLDNLLVDRIVCLAWRLRRLGQWRPAYSPKSATGV